MLGADGAEEFVSSMDRLDVSRGDIAELKQEMMAMELRFTEKLHAATSQLAKAIHDSTSELAKAISIVDKRIDQKHAQLIAWSFIFWVGAVASIAALAGVLRR